MADIEGDGLAVSAIAAEIDAPDDASAVIGVREVVCRSGITAAWRGNEARWVTAALRLLREPEAARAAASNVRTLR
jgi:hypothetical protein